MNLVSKNISFRGGILLCFSVTLFALSFPTMSWSDIYKFIDENGVVHFTNRPKNSKFRVYMKDYRQDRLLRTKFSASVGRPEDFEPIIISASTRYGVDANLVRAVIHAESGYNVNAISSAGAGGLMQLMPETARDLKVTDRFNASQNVDGGVRYLKFLIDTFHGDVRLALAAYNAGLARVVKYGGVPPFQETQQYVAKVLSLWKTGH